MMLVEGTSLTVNQWDKKLRETGDWSLCSSDEGHHWVGTTIRKLVDNCGSEDQKIWYTVFEIDIGLASTGRAAWKGKQVKYRLTVVHINRAIARTACRSCRTNSTDLLLLCAYFQLNFMGGISMPSATGTSRQETSRSQVHCRTLQLQLCCDSATLWWGSQRSTPQHLWEWPGVPAPQWHLHGYDSLEEEHSHQEQVRTQVPCRSRARDLQSKDQDTYRVLKIALQPWPILVCMNWLAWRLSLTIWAGTPSTTLTSGQTTVVFLIMTTSKPGDAIVNWSSSWQ